MPGFLRNRRTFILAIAGMCTASALGCHRGPAMYQVSGKIHYKGGAAPKAGVAVVNFKPTKDSTAEIRRGASGAIQPDGSFTMFSRMVGDGVYAGDYAVTFTVIKGPMDPASLILPKYSNPSTPPFTIKVDGDKADLDFELELQPGVAGSASASRTTSPAAG